MARVSPEQYAKIRARRIKPRDIEELQQIHAYEISGRVWYRFMDIARILHMSEATARYAQRLISGSESARKNQPLLCGEGHDCKVKQMEYDERSQTIMLIDAEAVRQLVIKYGFGDATSYLQALPFRGEPIENGTIEGESWKRWKKHRERIRAQKRARR